MIEKLYTVEEVAQLASVTGRTIRNYLKSGRLVGRKIGGQWRFPESEVQRLLAGGEAPTGDFSAFEDAPAYEAEPSYDDYPAQAGAPAPEHAYTAGQAYTTPREATYAPDVPYTNTPEPGYTPVKPEQPYATERNNAYTAERAQPQPYREPAANTPHPTVAPVREREPVLQPTAPAGQPILQPTAGGGYPTGTSAQAPAHHTTATQAPVQQPGQAGYPAAEAPGANAFSGRPAPAPLTAPTGAPAGLPGTAGGYTPGPSGSTGSYNAPAPLPTDAGVPPAPSQPAPGVYPEATGGYAAEPYTETYEAPAAYEPVPHQEEPEQPAPQPKPSKKQDVPEPAGESPGMPALSDTGLKVLQFVAEVHDCTAGPQTCTVVEVIHSLQQAQASITQLANLAAMESENGIPCECYVEYDERYSVARYTLFGSAIYLARALQIIT